MTLDEMIEAFEKAADKPYTKEVMEYGYAAVAAVLGIIFVSAAVAALNTF